MKSLIPLPRFSLKTLFIAVLGVAIAINALKFANPIWASMLFTLLLVVLFAGFLGAIFGRGERRVFCAGLVLSGLAYLMAVYGPWFESHVSRHLATTHLLSYLYDGMFSDSMPGSGMAGGGMAGGGMAAGPMVGPWRADVMRVGHSLFGFLLALLGGALARWFWTSSRQAPAAAPPLGDRTVQ